MVDKTVAGAKITAIRDAVKRIRLKLPPTVEAFEADRDAREIVLLNLFVALQECVALATHWLADDGLAVPQTYADVLRALGEQGILAPDLAGRLAAASGFRNLVAHRYAALDWTRVYAIASGELDDLLAFCDALAQRLGDTKA
jgi:uncharacterized protein YutE (UPF0331/DUF86 family)